jgi:hypothetical protein
MLKLSILSKFVFPAALLLIVLTGSAPAKPLFLLKKGQSWIYQGRVEWVEGTTIKSKQISWVTDIIEVFNYRDISIAVVRGLPTDLAWYTENKPRGYSLIAVSPKNAYSLDSISEEGAFKFAREFPNNPRKNLQLMNSFFSDLTEQCPNPKVTVKGFISKGKINCRETVFRTNPDVMIFDLVDNLGLTHFYYEHFGTVSVADVDLKEIRSSTKDRKIIFPQ